MLLQSVPKQTYGFFVEELEGEYLLFRLGAHKAIHLNETATLIWRLCDGSRSISEISDLLRAEYPDAPSIEQDVAATINQLEVEGALLETQQSSSAVASA